MRKEVKPAVKCKCCGQTTEYPIEEAFCDFCGKLLPKKMYPLELTIFKTVGGDDMERVEFDSWQCVKEYLIKNQKKLLCYHFVSLPMPVFRSNSKNRGQYTDTGANFLKVFLSNVTEQKKEL